MDDRWHIRRATPDDAASLAPLERRCFSDPWSESSFEELLQLSYIVALVAEEGDRIEAYLIARVIAGEAEILNLAVAPEIRRGGLGGRLLDRGLERLRKKGAERVWLEVRESNTAARELYLRRGFVDAGRRAKYYRAPIEDALVLQLPLPTPA